MVRRGSTTSSVTEGFTIDSADTARETENNWGSQSNSKIAPLQKKRFKCVGSYLKVEGRWNADGFRPLDACPVKQRTGRTPGPPPAQLAGIEFYFSKPSGEVERHLTASVVAMKP